MLKIEMTAKDRKESPVYSGVLKYFPDAMIEVSKCSYKGQQQHNPDKPLAWDRSKSGDELDALARHLLQAGTLDSDGIRHSAKVCWRALANLQKEIERDSLKYQVNNPNQIDIFEAISQITDDYKNKK
jgi:hypothetical protein|tara:strand:- start:205 stop:588 length:384 start_codon:yes stop_codon:yes gene_type:complete